MKPYELFRRQMEAFRPETFGDPLALTVDWKDPLINSTRGAFHKLVDVPPDRMEMRPGPLRWYVLGLSVTMFVVFLFDLGRNLLAGHPVRLEEYAVVPFALFIVLVGRFAWIGLGASYHFDRKAGIFSRPGSSRRHWNDPARPMLKGRLDQVHAVLLVPNLHRGKGGKLLSWSLELLLHDGQRVPLANHCWVRENREGERLAAFLAVPLWNPALDLPPELLV
ncbi:MAG: hypothetical protein RL318_2142 [Fibrobacterota bacterium]|jgi:hypothetical protein